ncbi:MAG: ABC transporter permease [Deltaproteobacteria bacterium]
MKLKNIILAVLVPFIMAIILVNSVSSKQGIKIPVAVVDEDKTEFSRFIIDGVSKNEALKVILTSRKTAEEMAAYNRIEAGFIISKGFEKRIKNEELTGLIKMIKNPRSISAEMIGESFASSTAKLICASIASNKVVEEYSKLLEVRPEGRDKLWNEAWKHTEEQWNQPEPIMKVDVIKINSRMHQKAGTDSEQARILIGVTAAFLMFFLLMGAWWISEEERNGTMNRIKVSIVSPAMIIAGNMLFLFLAGIIQTLLYLILFRFILDISIPITVTLFASLACYIFVISSIVFLLSAYFTPMQLGVFIPAFSLFTALAGGCFWDVTIFNKTIQYISLFTPQGWFMKIFDSPQFSMIINLFFLLIGSLLLWISNLSLKKKQNIL